MNIHVLTLFPNMFRGVFDESIAKRAVDRGLVNIRIHNIRDYSEDRHLSVDDYAFGGGGGMVRRGRVDLPTLRYGLWACVLAESGTYLQTGTLY